MVYRSRIKNIIFEFTIPIGKQKGVVILLDGMPSVPKLKDLLETLSANGYVALHPRYSGTWESPGTFLVQPPVKDIENLITHLSKKRVLVEAYAHKEFRVTTQNLILVGTSFGGAVALCASSSPAVKKVVALSPVTNWKTYTGSGTKAALAFLKKFLREGYGEGYRFTDAGWKKFASGKLFNAPKGLAKNITRKTTIVYDQSDTTTPPQYIEEYARAENISLKPVTNTGHISFSKFPPEKLLELLK
jgi:pimeloyl-ACP methyl ester carboxylesterase